MSDDHGTITFMAMCGWATRYSETDRVAGRDIRYCNMVQGHADDHDHVPDDDPRSYEAIRQAVFAPRFRQEYEGRWTP